MKERRLPGWAPTSPAQKDGEVKPVERQFQETDKIFNQSAMEEMSFLGHVRMGEVDATPGPVMELEYFKDSFIILGLEIHFTVEAGIHTGYNYKYQFSLLYLQI